MLVAYLARTYETKLDAGFFAAKQRIEAVIETDIRRHIGGDTQRIRSIHARYDAITFKHLLLTVWLLAYRYNENIYQVVVNAGTGEVQGRSPLQLDQNHISHSGRSRSCGHSGRPVLEIRNLSQ